MVAEKKKPEAKNTDTSGIEHSLRDGAEEQLARAPPVSPEMKSQTLEKLIHELRVHQIELETQAEELRNSKLALEESREKYLDLYEFAPVGYLTLTDKALIADANLTGAALLDIERSRLLMVPFSKFMPEKDADQWHLYFMNVLSQGGKQTCTLILIRADGSTFPARLEGVRLTGSDGAITVRVTISDVTDIRQSEDALRVTSKKLNLLSSITRHDITNQLTVLLGYLDILIMKQPDPALNEYFGKVLSAAQRISSMIQFTKEYEKIGVNAPAWQDTRTLVDTAAREVHLGKIMVKNDLPAGTEVFADPLIVKVCYNLMDNAVRYGGKITTIRFSVEKREGDEIIICEDDGDGIIAEDKEKIFDRGFGKNTGLGLALSREILDITGIAITDTGEPGKGARFEMTVPKGAWRMVGNGA
jgi:PAS domain S-box-containing protein